MDHYQRSARNTFAALALDRAAEHRENPEWLKQQLNSRGARFLPVYNDACLINPQCSTQPLLLRHNPVPEQVAVFLGKNKQHSYFSISLPAQHVLLNDVQRLINLRQAASIFDAEHAGLCAYALAVHQWHLRSRFCGFCGHAYQLQAAGHRLRCSNPACGQQAFPRLDPAMIVLVTHADSCLLGRQTNWPEKRYSSLAGFVEPGESLEDAVRREVLEEAGVRLAEIHYHSSQPWPFPASIMLGFTAIASDPAITIGEELEDARWWHANDIQAAVASGQLRLPYQLSISWQLLADWYQQQTGGRLADLSVRHAHRQI